MPAYQDIFFDRGLGYPSGALKTVCRDKETIIDVIPGCAPPLCSCASDRRSAGFLSDMALLCLQLCTFCVLERSPCVEVRMSPV